MCSGAEMYLFIWTENMHYKKRDLTAHTGSRQYKKSIRPFTPAPGITKRYIWPLTPAPGNTKRASDRSHRLPALQKEIFDHPHRLPAIHLEHLNAHTFSRQYINRNRPLIPFADTASYFQGKAIPLYSLDLIEWKNYHKPWWTSLQKLLRRTGQTRGEFPKI